MKIKQDIDSFTRLLKNTSLLKEIDLAKGDIPKALYDLGTEMLLIAKDNPKFKKILDDVKNMDDLEKSKDYIIELVGKEKYRDWILFMNYFLGEVISLHSVESDEEGIVIGQTRIQIQ